MAVQKRLLLDRCSSFFKRCLRHVLTFVYAPRRLCPESVERSLTTLVEMPDGQHRVVNVKNGRLFTELCFNVSVIKGRSLLASVSHNFSGEALYDSVKNKHGLINRLPRRIDKTVVSLVTGGGGNYNYYHWLFDVIPRLFVLEDSLVIASGFKLLVPDNRLSFQVSSLSRLGFHAEDILSSRDYSHCVAKRLIAISHPKAGSRNQSGRVSAWICERLRDALMSPEQKNASGNDRLRLYISRGDNTNQRVLVNESKLLNRLVSRGFRSVELSKLSFDEQVDLFARAEAVIGVHGAGLSNLVFAPPGCLVIEIAGQSYCPTMFEEIAAHRCQRYSRLLCEQIENGWPENSKKDIRLDDEQLVALLGCVDEYLSV